MSILSGYGKFKRYVLTDNGYKLCSQWTSSNTVHFDDGNTAQSKVGAINGITDSLTATNSNIALSAAAGKNLQDQVTQLNTGMGNIGKTVSIKWAGGMEPGEHTSANGVTLDNSAIYICTISVTGTANKDGGAFVAASASIGSFTFFGGDGAVSKKFITHQNVGIAVHTIFATGDAGNQKLSIYTNSENYIPDLTFRIGAVRIA